MRAFTIELPPPREHELVLEPNVKAIRGILGDEAPAAALEPLRRRLSLGEPVFRRVDVDSTDDAKLRRFLEQGGAEHDFYVGRLTCTFREEGDDRFASAVLDIDLSAGEGAAHAPIAWSMEPLRSYEPVELTRRISLNPSLKLLGLGLEASAEAGSKRERKEIFVEALYELESTPRWALYRTGSTPLRGGQRFALVVRSPKGAATFGNVAVSATLERKRLGIVPYRAAVAERPELAFELSPRTSETGRLEHTGS